MILNLIISFALAQNIETTVRINNVKYNFVQKDLYLKSLEYNFELETKNTKLKQLILDCCYEKMDTQQKKEFNNL